MKIKDVYVCFHVFRDGHYKDTYYVSLENVLNEHQDTYQDDRDERLFKWIAECNAYVPIPIT